MCGCPIESILLGPGADFELIFSAPPDQEKEISGIFQRNNWELHQLGSFTLAGENLNFGNGLLRRVPDLGWQHFSGQSDLDAIRARYTSSLGGSL